MSPYRKPGERVEYVEPAPEKDTRPVWNEVSITERVLLIVAWTFSMCALSLSIQLGNAWAIVFSGMMFSATSNSIFRSYR